MNILEALEKASGPETLATAALRFLILHGQPIRREVLRALSRASRHGSILSESHFACYREHRVYNGDKYVGRLDLVIETDNVVAGIESKFYATFTTDQPGKYLPHLQAHARALRELRRTSDIRPELFVLAPESRRDELQTVLEAQGIDFVSWEELLRQIEQAIHDADELSQAVSRDLKHYVNNHLSYLADVRHELEAGALLRSFPPQGTETQAKVMSAIRDVIGAPESRIDRDKSWCGFYVTRRTDNNGPSYLGMFPENRFEGSGTAVRVVFATMEPFQLDPQWFTPYTPARGAVFLITRAGGKKYSKARYHWQVKLDAAWEDANLVRRLFEPVVRTRRVEEPSDSGDGDVDLFDEEAEEGTPVSDTDSTRSA